MLLFLFLSRWLMPDSFIFGLSSSPCKICRVSYKIFRIFVAICGINIVGRIGSTCRINNSCIAYNVELIVIQLLNFNARTTRNQSVKGGSSQIGNLPDVQG